MKKHDKMDGSITATVVNIGLKRNAEDMLNPIKPIFIALNKLQKDHYYIANPVEIWKECREMLKQEIPTSMGD